MAKRSKKTTSRKRAPDTPDPKAVLELPAPVAPGAILGQGRALDVLRSSLRSGRLHHAWIFHGPAGVGKFTAAMTFAAALLDPQAGGGAPKPDEPVEDTGPSLFGGPEPEPEPAQSAHEPGDAPGGDPLAVDPESPCQRLIRAGTHPDLHVVVKELARFEDDASVRDAKLATIPKAVVQRYLIEPAALAASNDTGGAAAKVFVVDEAELLDRSPTNAPVQNALLKTLEEPPPRTVFILVTSSEDRLLPTIRSRCQRVAFTPLPDEAMRAWASTRGLGLDPEAADWYVAYADGSPGALLRAVEANLASWAGELAPMLRDCSRGRGSASLGSRMAALADDWAKAYVAQGEPRGERRSKETANRMGAARVLGVVAHHYRAGLVTSHAELAADAIDAVDLAMRTVSSNVQAQFVFEDLSAMLTELGRSAGVAR